MHHLPSKPEKQCLVIAPAGKFFQFAEALLGSFPGFLNIQNGVVKVLFGGKMAKQNRLADACRSGDIFRLGAAKSLLCEALDGDSQELAFAIVYRHAAAYDREVGS